MLAIFSLSLLIFTQSTLASSSDDDWLDLRDLSRHLARRSVVPEPMPTAAQPCGVEYPADINFIFSASTMDFDAISNVTSFIDRVIIHDKLSEGFQYGVVSGDCPNNGGFTLNQFNSPQTTVNQVHHYEQNNLQHYQHNLPRLIYQAIWTWYTDGSGARDNAIKTAVIFLDQNKMSKVKLDTAIRGMVSTDVRVFVSLSDNEVSRAMAPHFPEEVTLLEGTMSSQITALVNHLCPNAK